MFESVRKTNIAFGKHAGNYADLVSQQDEIWNRIEKQAICIPEEVEELMDAIAIRDPIALRDAVSDILVFTLGLPHIGNWDVEKDMQAVFGSNMSKFCTTPQSLLDTISKYESLDVVHNVNFDGNVAYLTSAKHQIGLDGKLYPEGKFLKSVEFKEPNFE